MPNSALNAVVNCIMTNYLISIIGPTAIGKTALSIELSKAFNTQIISSDSRQFYKEMSIGTAVPSKDELSQAKHHFIQHISIEDNYSVGDFERDAIAKLEELFKENKVVIMVGGSGLYVNAVTKGLDNFPDIEEKIRIQLNKELKEKGLTHLQNTLEKLDPKAYKTIAIDNPRRVTRALEVCLQSGKPYSSFLSQKKPKRNFKVVTVGLMADREIIYSRINNRVDKMIEMGLLNEAEKLYSKKGLNALETVGYKELFNFFEEKYDLDTAIAEIKKNTRRFAKRQLTWFKKNEETKWFDYQTNYKEISNYIKSVINENN